MRRRRHILSFAGREERCFAAAVGGVRKNRTLTPHPSQGCCRVLAVPASTPSRIRTYRRLVLARTSRVHTRALVISIT
jgi:hypothetical protein